MIVAKQKLLLCLRKPQEGFQFLSAIRRYIFENFKAFQVKPFEYVNIQFHRVVGVESVNWTLIKRNYKATSIT